MQKTLEEKTKARTEARLIVVNLGECRNCYWKSEMKRRIAENPDYIPYGGWRDRRKCIDDKNYKNCSGYKSN